MNILEYNSILQYNYVCSIRDFIKLMLYKLYKSGQVETWLTKPVVTGLQKTKILFFPLSP